jgi:amidase
MVPVAHASDGGGSIRVPASECGLVGLKPSRGRISLGPDYGDYWHGLVTSHVVSRSVRDAAAMLDAVSGPMPGDPYSAPPPLRPFGDEPASEPARLRIGLMPQAPAGAPECDRQCSGAVESTGKLLESLGHEVSLAYPAALDEHLELVGDFTVIVGCWTARALDHWSEVVGRHIAEGDVEDATWGIYRQAEAVTAATYLAAVERMHRWCRRMAAWWSDGFDLLVTPTISTPPPRLGEIVGDADGANAAGGKIFALISFTPQFNVTGQPALSLPLAWSSDGLPIGVQLVGASHREDLLLRVAGQLERAQPWADRRPPIWAGNA